MTMPDAPDQRNPAAASDIPEAEGYRGAAVDEIEDVVATEAERASIDLWGMSFAYPLVSGAQPSRDPVTLDPHTAREVRDQLRDIEEARAAANVSGRDYLIK